MEATKRSSQYFNSAPHGQPLIASQSVLQPYTYLMTNSGKEIRTRMIDAFNVWLDVPKEELSAIERVVSMLHNASLLYVSLSNLLGYLTCEIFEVWTTWKTTLS